MNNNEQMNNPGAEGSESQNEAQPHALESGNSKAVASGESTSIAHPDSGEASKFKKDKKSFYLKNRNKKTDNKKSLPPTHKKFNTSSPGAYEFNKHKRIKEQVEDNVEEVAPRVLSEQEQLKNLIQHSIRQKTGISTDKINDLLNIYFHKYNDCNLDTPSGTNIVGLCLLNDNALALKLITAIFPSDKIEFPKVLGKENINVSFSRDGELNREILNFVNTNEAYKNILLQEILSFAPTNLYREENIKLYLKWFTEHSSQDDKEKFIVQCLMEKNRAIIEQSLSYAALKELVISNYKSHASDKNFLVWLETRLDRQMSAPSSYATPHIPEAASLPSADTHLSSKEDKIKAFTNIDKRPVIIEKKKKLSLRN